MADLRGGDPESNAAALRALLAGETGAYRDIVLLNAAAAFLVADRAETLREGVDLAADVDRFRRRRRGAGDPDQGHGAGGMSDILAKDRRLQARGGGDPRGWVSP